MSHGFSPFYSFFSLVSSYLPNRPANECSSESCKYNRKVHQPNGSKVSIFPKMFVLILILLVKNSSYHSSNLLIFTSLRHHTSNKTVGDLIVNIANVSQFFFFFQISFTTYIQLTMLILLASSENKFDSYSTERAIFLFLLLLWFFWFVSGVVSGFFSASS